MIRDARVLQDDYLPREIVHRHEETNRLSAALEPVIEGDTPQNAVLTGPSGAGKTCVARATLDRLGERLLDVHAGYVDCWMHSREFRVLYKLLEGAGRAHGVHRNTPTDELVDRLREFDKPYLAILDEADQLRSTDVLRHLYSVPGITTVLIANARADLFDPLDQRLQSRLRAAESIDFDRYGHEELVAILSDRVEWGLDEEAIDRAHLEWMAEAAAGDARDAIGILRSAARRAQREGADRLRDDHVEEAVPEARAELRQKNVDRLNDHQRELYYIVTEATALSPGEIYDRYHDRVDSPRTRRTVRTYLRKLEQYNLVESSGNGPDRQYREFGGS